MGSADPPGKMDEKLKSENTQKSSFLNGGWENGSMLTTCLFRYRPYFRMHHFVVKFSKIFASGGKGALTP